MKNLTRRKQLKIDKKKRKKKQAHREANRTTDLAYSGAKYRKTQYVPLFTVTETAILEAFVLGKRRLTDHDVSEGITTLIEQLRTGSVRLLDGPSNEEPQLAFDMQEFMVWNIVQHWTNHFERSEPVGRDVLVGVLRTTLHSITVWGSSNPTSRGYLHYIEDFLKNSGVASYGD